MAEGAGYVKREKYMLIENYMQSCMKDSAHDKEHIYRVLYNALYIAKTEKNVDYDILICACLLHDIGRKEELENPNLCHAAVGSEKARSFLADNGYTEAFAIRVRDCILQHRYRKSNPPQSIEAKILFDADKIDVAGAVGIARTLIYKGQISESLYSLMPDGEVSNGDGDSEPSFFQEYKYKLEKVYSKFFTKRGVEIANQRQSAAVDFYNALFSEVAESYKNGIKELYALLSN